MAKPVVIGSRSFRTQSSALEHYKAVLHRYQDGQRVYGHDVNRLTVIATESYQEFADQLQKEIEADTGIRFGIVEQHQFATIAITTPDGKVALLAGGTDAAVASGFSAGNVVKAIAGLVGGRGGGRPNMAQAGGSDVSGIDAALEAAKKELGL